MPKIVRIVNQGDHHLVVGSLAEVVFKNEYDSTFNVNGASKTHGGLVNQDLHRHDFEYVESEPIPVPVLDKLGKELEVGDEVVFVDFRQQLNIQRITDVFPEESEVRMALSYVRKGENVIKLNS